MDLTDLFDESQVVFGNSLLTKIIFKRINCLKDLMNCSMVSKLWKGICRNEFLSDSLATIVNNEKMAEYLQQWPALQGYSNICIQLFLESFNTLIKRTIWIDFFDSFGPIITTLVLVINDDNEFQWGLISETLSFLACLETVEFRFTKFNEANCNLIDLCDGEYCALHLFGTIPILTSEMMCVSVKSLKIVANCVRFNDSWNCSFVTWLCEAFPNICELVILSTEIDKFNLMLLELFHRIDKVPHFFKNLCKLDVSTAEPYCLSMIQNLKRPLKSLSFDSHIYGSKIQWVVDTYALSLQHLAITIKDCLIGSRVKMPIMPKLKTLAITYEMEEEKLYLIEYGANLPETHMDFDFENLGELDYSNQFPALVSLSIKILFEKWDKFQWSIQQDKLFIKFVPRDMECNAIKLVNVTLTLDNDYEAIQYNSLLEHLNKSFPKARVNLTKV